MTDVKKIEFMLADNDMIVIEQKDLNAGDLDWLDGRIHEAVSKGGGFLRVVLTTGMLTINLNRVSAIHCVNGDGK